MRIFSATEWVSTVQGHQRSMIFVQIESAYATFYYSVLVILLISCNVSEIHLLRRLIGWKFRIYLPSLIRSEVNHKETIVTALPSSDDGMIVAW